MARSTPRRGILVTRSYKFTSSPSSPHPFAPTQSKAQGYKSPLLCQPHLATASKPLKTRPDSNFALCSDLATVLIGIGLWPNPTTQAWRTRNLREFLKVCKLLFPDRWHGDENQPQMARDWEGQRDHDPICPGASPSDTRIPGGIHPQSKAEQTYSTWKSNRSGHQRRLASWRLERELSRSRSGADPVRGVNPHALTMRFS